MVNVIGESQNLWLKLGFAVIHKIIGQFGLEGVFKGHLVHFPVPWAGPSSMGSGCSDPSNVALSVYRDEASTSLAKLLFIMTFCISTGSLVHTVPRKLSLNIFYSYKFSFSYSAQLSCYSSESIQIKHK